MNLSKPLIFLGSNQNLLIYIETAKKQNLTIAGIVDHDYYGNTDSLHGIDVIGSENSFFENNKDDFVYFVGSNWSPHSDHNRDKNKRKKFIDIIKQYNLTVINLVDLTAIVSSYSIFGKGIFVGPNAIIDPNCTINDYAQIHHNVNIISGSKIGVNSVIQRNSIIEANIDFDTYICMLVKIFPYFSADTISIGNNVLIYPEVSIHKSIKSYSTVSSNV